MSYLLDTNVCIALINPRPSAIRDRAMAMVRQRATLFVPTIVLFELDYGIAKLPEDLRARQAAKVAKFRSGPFEYLSFEVEDSEQAGRIRGFLQRAGTPIGPYDTLIAGQALARDLVLVTGNVREFSRVPELRWEDWSRG